MAVVGNRFYNDPAIGAAFGNLAAAFAPPSGSDLAGYAAASATKQEAKRLADLFRVAQSADIDQNVFDRMGQAAGQWTPSTGYYGVNVGAETDRRGQDVSAAAQRYGYDRTFEASTSNNMRDNQRALQTSAMDNQRQTITGLYGTPLDPGQIMPAVPEDIMQAVGLPGVTERAGLPAPVTQEDLEAAVFGSLPAEQQQAIVFGDTPVEQIVTPDGPRLATRTQALGQEPVVQQGSQAKPTNAVARLPTGENVPAIQDNTTGRWRHAQTGEELPAGIQIFDPPKATGSAQEVGMGTTANQTSAQAIRGAVSNSAALVEELDALVRNNPAATGLAGDLIGFTQDVRQVFNEFGQQFGNDPNQLISPQDLSDLAGSLIPNDQGYNPVYRQARAMLLELAYSNARMNNPSGEVSRFALEREIEALGQGLAGNDQGLLAVLDVARSRMRRKLQEADVLDGRAEAPTIDSIGGPRQPMPSAAPAGGGTRMRFDENGNMIQ